MVTREHFENLRSRCESLTQEETGIILAFFILATSLNKQDELIGLMQSANMSVILSYLQEIDPKIVDAVGEISEKLAAKS